LLFAICLRKERKTEVFGKQRKKKARKAMADGETTVPMGLFIAQSGGDESVVVHWYAFYPWI